MAPNQSKPEDNDQYTDDSWRLNWFIPTKPKAHGTWIDVEILPKIIEALQSRIALEGQEINKWERRHQSFAKECGKLEISCKWKGWHYPRLLAADCSMKMASKSIGRLNKRVAQTLEELNIMETMLNVFLTMPELEASCKGIKNGGNNGGSDRDNDGSGSGGAIGGGGAVGAVAISVVEI